MYIHQFKQYAESRQLFKKLQSTIFKAHSLSYLSIKQDQVLHHIPDPVYPLSPSPDLSRPGIQRRPEVQCLRRCGELVVRQLSFGSRDTKSGNVAACAIDVGQVTSQGCAVAARQVGIQECVGNPPGIEAGVGGLGLVEGSDQFLEVEGLNLAVAQ